MQRRSDDEQTLAAGTLVDVYEIERVLGTGNFGITYRARDRQLDCAVALKEYFPGDLAQRVAHQRTVSPRSQSHHDSYQWGLRRFLDEARTLARFKEPGIVRVNRLFEDNGTAYLVMDYVEGDPLDERVRSKGALNEAAALAVLEPLLLGLQALHGQNILHRDIKPANIFLRSDGQPVLLDFGAAREALKGQNADLTTILTPGYAPLEQYTRSEAQGPWSDLYALGATLFHCVAGYAPTPAPDRMARRAAKQPDPLAAQLLVLRGRLSTPLLLLIIDLMKLSPQERPQSAQAVLARMGRVAPVAATQAGPDAPPEPGTAAEAPAGPAARRIALPAATVERIEALAAAAGGTFARRAVGPALMRAQDGEELIDMIGGFIGDDAARRDFDDHARVILKAAARAGSEETLAAPGGATAMLVTTGAATRRLEAAVDEAFTDEAARQLAEFIGPIARTLVQRAAARIRERNVLLHALAEELDDAGERALYLARMEPALRR